MTAPRADGARPAAARARGVLRRSPPEGTLEHLRLVPHPDLAHVIAHFWWVRWDLPRPFVTETLPHPSVHIVFESRRPTGTVVGVHTSRFTRRLVGSGWVFGIKFRPAAFQPFLRGQVATITDRVVSLQTVFGNGVRRLGPELREASSPERAAERVEAYLLQRLPELPATVIGLRDLVERLATEHELLRVSHAAAIAGMDVRTLQRRFLHYVGVGPKWVIQRYRLHEAAEQLKTHPRQSLASLAATLGYADQAHFVRDFKAMIGRTPTAFAKAEGTG